MRNETSRDPVYEERRRWSDIVDVVCTECGAVVHAQYLPVHTRWHWKLWAEA